MAMLTKVFAVILLMTISVSSGSPKKCYSCEYNYDLIKRFPKCFGVTIPCTTGHCYSLKYTTSNGLLIRVQKGCDFSSTVNCSNRVDFCHGRQVKETLLWKSCSISCCDTNLCNGGATQTPMKTVLGFVFLIVIVFLY
ncbi:uncharacterized protein LOC124450798 [Xenia sp. Carnegie-2017]|uniref:uncharacterized protein LOC124450798 n=1 Tax=Xenia sp. Carnegie-2017 TaxID=2897299 RepID=UPI001F038312|nr:uncharacterized protein LOC124450798 [Xenia sp. Carnegie-2017]